MNLHDILLASKIAQKNGGNADLTDYYTKNETEQRITEKVAEIVANAPEDFDTLREISDWIASHEDSASAMNSAITTNTTAINNKVDKVSGKGLSANDFTTALKNKLNGLENYNDTQIKNDIAFNKSTLGYQRKNQLKITTAPNVKNGVSFSVSDDGILTLNGTATASGDAYFPEYTYSVTEADTWISINEKSIISCYGTLNSFSLCYYSPDVEQVSANKTFKTINNSNPFVLEKGSVIIGLYVGITSGVDYTGKTLSVMLRNAEITDSTYEPYVPSADERLSGLENQIITLDSVEDFDALTDKTADFYFIKEG